MKEFRFVGFRVLSSQYVGFEEVKCSALEETNSIVN